jgi:electron transfer flavoprotein alpha subunit
MTPGVLCLVEHDEGGVIEASSRALSVARRLAESSSVGLGAVLVGEIHDGTLATLADFGVDDIYLVAGEALSAFAPVAWARSLLELAGLMNASAVIAAGTDRGNEVMAHAGALSGLTMVANCFNATRDGDTLHLTRQRWAGSLIEQSRLETPLVLLTVAFDGVSAEKAHVATTPMLHQHQPTLERGDLELRVAEWKDRSAGISLADARVVVGGGRGVGSAEGFASLEELAQLLGGAVGVSRAVTSLGWRPHNQQVGQTGTRISPELYLVSGISGATQHLAGCQSAKHVVAINTDPDAPIISRADYAVIGDLNVIIPALNDAIKTRRATGA